MADVWAFVLLLAWVFGVCEGSICTRMTYHSYFHTTTTYIYCSYGCCGSSYNRYCCTSSGTIAGIVIAVLCGICIIAFFVCLCVKKQKRPGRVIMPNSAVPQSNVTVVYAGMSAQGSSGYRGGPPAPPPYKAHDPPPPYAYGHFTTTGSGPNNSGQINTAGLPYGSYNPPPPSQPPPAWQAPPRGAPPVNENPPMPQPQPPPRSISSPAPPYTATPANNNSVFHPPPEPLPPATAPISHTQ